MLRFRKDLKDLEKLSAAFLPEDDHEYFIHVNANESNQNLPPIVEERLMARFASVAFHRYPGYEYDSLREQIARNFALQKEQVLLGNGSADLLEKIFYLFGGSPGQKIIYMQPSCPLYPPLAAKAGAIGIPIQLKEDFSLDKEEILNRAIEEKAALVVICNPNNPTGTAYSVSDIQYLAENLPMSCALLVDEAYVEFCGKSSVDLLKEYPNLMISRTFSKAYGLASARVGYLLADSKIIEKLQGLFLPCAVNTLSLVAADIVFQMRAEYVPRIQMIIAERKRMSKEIAAIQNCRVAPSEANFLLLFHKQGKELYRALQSHGISVRLLKEAPLKNQLRISVGLREENDTIIQTIKAFSEEKI
jgi:histidinol-phosphate aminotransferase